MLFFSLLVCSLFLKCPPRCGALNESGVLGRRINLVMGMGRGSAGGEVSWMLVLFLLCISSSFGLFSGLCPGPHQPLLGCWPGKLPHHLFLLAGLVEPGGPCIPVPPRAQEAFRSACGCSLA